MAQKESSRPNPQGRKTNTVAKPMVFISASSQDFGWRDRLKSKINAFADRIEWWDDSKIKPSSNWKIEIEAAIERSNVAVVLLSPVYLSSETATSELTQLGQKAKSSGLKLFPIVLQECAWKQFSFLQEVQIWSVGEPLGNMNSDAAENELERIAKSILDLARADSEHRADSTSPEFSFSTTAKAVLDRAWALAEKSGRTGITSSCLLFAIADASGAQSDATLFVRKVLNQSGHYQDALNTFLKDGGISARHSSSEAVGLPWKFSLNVRAILEKAADIATRVGKRSREIHTRHLFAALLVASEADSPIMARDRLRKLGFDLPRVYSDFREHLRVHASSDNSAEWDVILGTAKQPMTGDNQTDTRIAEQTLADSGISEYQKTYCAFIPDRAVYGRRDVNAQMDDSLGVSVYAGHLAQLIAAKETFMPLSIGLFGAWGVGKSHFIDLLDEQLRALQKEPGRTFHKEIVQIRFNAWHYLDTNLWANLVSEIFDQLFDRFEKRGDKEAKQVENLKNKLAEQSALAAEAKNALKTAESARVTAEDKLRKAIKEREEKENTVEALLDDLSALVTQDEIKKELNDVASGLGLPKLKSSFAELEACAEEVRSLSGRIKALVLAILTKPGWWIRGILLVAALVAPLAVSWLAEQGWMKDLLSGAGRTIGQVVATITALSAWISYQVRCGQALIGKLETAYDRVKKVRAEREGRDDAAKAQKELAAKRHAEDEARHILHEAEEKKKAISAELSEMAPGRQLIRFLKERASTEDYRRYLGLVGLARRDFEQLSHLLMESQDPEEPQLPKIDRIVLYIDDLDRCRADRVIEVLEAVHLLLAFPLFAVVVAVDPRWLRQSLLDHYPHLLGGVAKDRANSLAPMLERPATPQDYLEKIFQVPFNLQPMEKTGFDALVNQLFPIAVSSSKDAPTGPSAPASADDVGIFPAVLSPEIGTKPEMEKIVASTPLATQTIEKIQVSPDPQRLTLTKEELRDVHRFHLLFQTPRALKRLANTYSLIRVGVGKEEWNDYLGFDETPGIYRVPLLLLAVTSAFPAVARPWLLWLNETGPTRWQLDEKNIMEFAKKYRDTTDRADWDRLASSLNKLDLRDWPVPEPELLAKWTSRVARYSF
jgi:hypothetical protein